MRTGRATSMLLAAWLMSGCGEDDGGSPTTASASTGGDSTMSGASDTGMSASGMDDATGSGSLGTSDGPADTTDADGTTDDDGSTATDGTTGGGVVPIELSNDAWRKQGAVFFQGGFAMDECWASTYVPAPEHYPFEVIGAAMAVGGEDAGSADFSIAIWSVDATGQPLEQIDAGTTNVSGNDNGLDIVPLEIIGVSAPPFTEGNFALVVCFSAHAGLPSIAADADGLTHADRNWIRLEDGTWAPAADFDVSGDWIMRATILPM